MIVFHILLVTLATLLFDAARTLVLRCSWMPAWKQLCACVLAHVVCSGEWLYVVGVAATAIVAGMVRDFAGWEWADEKRVGQEMCLSYRVLPIGKAHRGTSVAVR